MATEHPANGIRVYISSISSNRDVKNKQARMLQILESKKIPFEKIDIAKDRLGKTLMHRLCKDDHAMPPVISKGDQYLGDFQVFLDAVDDEILEKFLQLS